MVVLHTSDGDIEVRLVKLDSDTESFEEYGYVDELDFDIDSDEAIKSVKRLIVAQEVCYGIEVTLKKGFRHGIYIGGFFLKLDDVASGKEMDDEEVFRIEKIPQVMLEGEVRNDVSLAFHALNPEDNISDDLNDAQLGSLKVTIVRLGKLRETGAILSSHVSVPDMTKRRDDTGQVNYNKRGVTHDISFIGGTSNDKSSLTAGTTVKNLVNSDTRESYEVIFIPRAASYLEQKNMFEIEKTPIELHHRPWTLVPIIEDQRLTVAHKISLAGEEANTEEIRRQILHEGVRPNKWRKWSQLMARERPILYKELQQRLQYFWRGEIPPEEQPLPSIRKAQERPRSPEAEPIRAVTIKEEEPEDQAQPIIQKSGEHPLADIQKPSEHSRSLEAETASAVTIKEEEPEDQAPPINQESGEKSGSVEVVAEKTLTIKEEPQEILIGPPKKWTGKPVVISLLSDSEHEQPTSRSNNPSTKRSKSAKAAPRIKSEPTNIPSFDTTSSQAPIPTPGGVLSVTSADNPAKRIKVESEASQPSPSRAGADTKSLASDVNLRRLKDEDEELEAELAAAQRVSALLEKRREKKARIAAIEEERRSVIDTPSVRGLD
ncbi:hypothetical protein GLAREA_01034 [Glarea lozoyensis ATCC 20868]|uniref:Uncharacterized protein n=1 Tax=Glarea lozoyensis (strain ATCC 20868 / MF5171) TaxID=1116229 RepID=S3CY52_GLAL2|nr:uncharacterized protein GLAREA_01034 [Glarea lozoyensis ATCC 20868]EPE29874.1 hypothetical protein GLAREA_01034 [Glarea lozoyensis ATCC 20868]